MYGDSAATNLPSPSPAVPRSRVGRPAAIATVLPTATTTTATATTFRDGPSHAFDGGNQRERTPPGSPASPQGRSAATTAPPHGTRRTTPMLPQPSAATPALRPETHRDKAEEKRRRKEEKRRERRRRLEEEEEERRESAPPPRRRIPTPPHRQLFLVDGYYCGADPNGFPEQLDPLLALEQRQPGSRSEEGRASAAAPAAAVAGNSRANMNGSVTRSAADAVVLSNRAGVSLSGGHSFPANATLRGANASLSLTINNSSSFAATTNQAFPQRTSFYVPPSVPTDFQLPSGASNRSGQTPSPAMSPNTAAPSGTAALPPGGGGQAAGAAAGASSSPPPLPHKREKLRIKRRFYEPVELQVESLSAFIMRLTLFLWYACLVAALIVEVIPRVQWSMVNVCGSDVAVDLRYDTKWSSPCATTALMEGSTTAYVVSWPASGIQHLHSKFVRFRRLVLSLPTPATQLAEVAEYALTANTAMATDDTAWFSSYAFTLRCEKRRSRCDLVRIPEDLLGEAGSDTSYTFSLAGVPAELAAGAADGAVGIAYQRSAYTVATIVWRYVLMFLSVLHIFRFIAFRKFTSTLYEQSWTLVLQVALIWYLDPLFALNIVSWPLPSVLSFLEYRMPTYFIAVLVAYMLSVMTASMAWSTAAAASAASSSSWRFARLFARAKAFLLRSRNVYDPPTWTKIIVVVYMLSIFVLDIVDACIEQRDWYGGSNSNVRFKRIYWSVIALLLLGSLVCLILLLYLRNYLGNKPYLESRPQQLACRVFIMIFFSAVAYYVLHCLLFFLLYNSNYPAVASQQPFLQLPALMIASFFVNIMTLVYTSQNRDDSVPINPKDVRWKHMVWPDTWYRWLARHGGSQYIFVTEVEETRFYRLQFEFRKRQFLAKQKRKFGGYGSASPSRRNNDGAAEDDLYNISSAFEPASTLNPNREATYSGFMSMLRTRSDRRPSGTLRTSRVMGPEGTWRTDVWETPMPSRPVSPDGSEHDDAHRESASFTRPQQQQQQQQREGASGGRNDGQHTPSLLSANATAVSFARSRNNSFVRAHSAGFTPAGAGVTPIHLAARSILNMDRFSTYFLADGGDHNTALSTALNNSSSVVTAPAPTAGRYGGGAANTSTPPTGSRGAAAGRSGGGGWGGGGSRLPSPDRSPRREASGAFDAYEVEGPAHRRSRLLQGSGSGSAVRRGDSVLLQMRSRHENTTGATTPLADRPASLSRTFAGFECQPPYVAEPPAAGGQQQQAAEHEEVSGPLHVGSGLRGGFRHVRSHSDGDAPRSPRSLPLYSSGQHSGGAAALSRVYKGENSGDAAAAAEATARARRPTQAPVPAPAAVLSASLNDTVPAFTESMNTGLEESNTALFREQSMALLQAIQQVQQTPAPQALPTFAATPTVQDLTPGDVRGAASVRAAAADRRSPPSLRPQQTHSTFYRGHSGDDEDDDDDVASDLSHSSSSEERSLSGHRRSGKRSLFRTLNVVRERLGAAMGAAEKNLFEKPARGLDRLEMQIFDAAYRPFQSLHYLPFFNLETAIDCYNISWEAYGVEKSLGDDVIETGIKITPQNVPKTVAHGVKKIMCGCCAAEEEDDEDENNHDGAERDSQNEEDSSSDDGDNNDRDHRGGGGSGGEEGRGEAAGRRGSANATLVAASHSTGNATKVRSQRGGGNAAVPPSTGAKAADSAGVEMASRPPSRVPATQAESPPTTEGNREENAAASAVEPEPLHRSVQQPSKAAVVLVHMSGKGSDNQVPKAERSPEEKKAQNKLADLTAEQARRISESGPPPNPATPPAPADPNLFPINVEKYGYTLLLVAEAKSVQVIMVKMDTTAPEHAGKAPRIIIGFRGTANMDNAKYDMNIHRVVWREMERTEEEDSRMGLGSAGPADAASTVDGNSTLGSQSLGCAACLRSCARATSWRPTCHAGFLSIWKTLKPTVMQRLREIVQEDRDIVYRIFTTGHSLGGALASLSAYSITAVLRRLDYPIPEVTVYTFGQPRMGNSTFQRIYNKAVPRSFGVVNESDMVVTMTMFGGYHVGIEVDIDRNGNYIVKPTEIEKLFPPTTGRGLTVINHLMTNYGISLNAIASRTTCPARGLGCYLTADPAKIALEQAKEEALRQLQENRRPTDGDVPEL